MATNRSDNPNLTLYKDTLKTKLFKILKRDWKVFVRIGLFMNVIIVLFLIAWFIAGKFFDKWKKLKVIFNKLLKWVLKKVTFGFFRLSTAFWKSIIHQVQTTKQLFIA